MSAEDTAQIEAQLVRARKKFDAFDVDENGRLEGEEMTRLANWVWSSFRPDGEVLPAEERRAEAEKIMRRADANGDGCMDFDEFASYFRKTAESIAKFRKQRSARNKAAMATKNDAVAASEGKDDVKADGVSVSAPISASAPSEASRQE